MITRETVSPSSIDTDFIPLPAALIPLVGLAVALTVALLGLGLLGVPAVEEAAGRVAVLMIASGLGSTLLVQQFRSEIEDLARDVLRAAQPEALPFDESALV